MNEAEEWKSSWEIAREMRFFRLRLFLEWLGFPCWGEYYHCTRCGLLFRKDSVPISGHNAEHSLRHVYCPRCLKKIYVQVSFRMEKKK